mgnify:CR=1 FL=1
MKVGTFAIGLVLLAGMVVGQQLGKDKCPLTAANIFETTGNTKVGAYTDLSMKKRICGSLGITGVGDNQSCCSREELEGLEMRWRSTKWKIYKNRISGWASVVKSISQNEKQFQTHIDELRKLKAVKLDCSAAAQEVLLYFDRNNPNAKQEPDKIWAEWRSSANKCLEFTLKVKYGQFCAICSPTAYNDILYPNTDRSTGSIKISYGHCKDFLTACADFIKQQAIVKEFVSAIAALSKCDARGWTPFDQPYLYKAKDPIKMNQLNTFQSNPSDIDNNKQLCQAEYSMTTMLGSDLRSRDSWLSFATNAASVFQRYSINKTMAIDALYQADDEYSIKQDMPNYDVIVSAAVRSLIDYEQDSGFEPPINADLVKSITEHSMIIGVISAIYLTLLAI